MNERSNLILVRTQRELAPLTPAVLLERAAAAYIKIAIEDFRELVKNGLIPARRHPGRVHKIYLKEDLDSYLRNLPRVEPDGSRIADGEAQSKPHFPKEVSSGT